jgi:hypothetical protein
MSSDALFGGSIGGRNALILLPGRTLRRPCGGSFYELCCCVVLFLWFVVFSVFYYSFIFIELYSAHFINAVAMFFV